MYKKKYSTEEIEIKFKMPFAESLDAGNRWIRLAQQIPWNKIEEEYASNFSSMKGSPAKNVRMALGALIIQAKCSFTDRETVEQIIENPYLQYFVGLEEFKKNRPFHDSMMTHFRKRFTAETINKINEWIVLPEKDENENNNDDGNNTSESSSDEAGEKEENNNKGKLILDASCAPADIQYPTDIALLNKARLLLEEIIDELFVEFVGKEKKPRTYRKKAKKVFHNIMKEKQPKMKTIRAAIRKLLGFVRRDLQIIQDMSERVKLTKLSKKQYKNLLVINELFRQQDEMYSEKKHKVDNRIVSISQPHVRPIVRGKASGKVEFGAKISISVVNGFTFMGKVSWENFNEGTTLKDEVEEYYRRFGCYPEAVLGDKIYRNRPNREYCKERGIRLSGPPLGRPPILEDAEKRKRKREQSEDYRKRVEVEGKFGEGKRAYGLGKIKTKLDKTSETEISIIILVMNLQKKLRLLLHLFFRGIFSLSEPLNSVPDY